MTTTNTSTKPNTTDALATAKTNRRHAEDQHTEAQDRVALVRTELDQLRACAITGQPVTARELATAGAAVPHAELLAQAAAHALDASRAEERAAVSAHYVEELSKDVSLSDFEAAHAEELSALHSALAAYISGLSRRNATIRGAIAGARAVGIGHTNEHGEGLTLSGMGTTWSLYIDGTHVRETRPDEAAIKVVESAFSHNGYILTATSRAR